MDKQIAMRSLSFILYGGQQEYESYMVLKEWFLGNKLIQNPPEFHTFTLAQRLEFNKQQYKQLVDYVKTLGGFSSAQGIIVHLYNLIGIEVGRPFQIHGLFIYLLKQFFKSYPQFQQLLEECDQLQIMGSILFDEYDFKKNKRINHNFDSIETKLIKDIDGYKISTSPSVGKSGIYFSGEQCNMALILCKYENDGNYFLALVQLKDKNNNLQQGVSYKWLGKSLQLTCNWSIHLNNVNVLDVIKLNDLMKLNILSGMMDIQDCQNQLNDVLRLSYIAVQYCTMRKQFRTTEDKTERSILTYQVTTERIISALSFAINYTDTTNKLKAKYMIEISKQKERTYQNYIFVKHFTNTVIQKSMETIEILREALGGFGYLRFSGAPTIQERALWLYQQYTFDIDKYAQQLYFIFNDFDKVFINSMIGSALTKSSDKILDDIGYVNETIINSPFQTFAYFGAKTRQVLEKCQGKSLHPQQQIQYADFIVKIYNGIQSFNLLAFIRYRQSNYILDRLFLYSTLQEQILIENNQNIRTLINSQITKTQQELFEHLPLIVNSLEIDNVFTDSLIGQSDQDKFYEQLLNLAKNHNLRNDPNIKQSITSELGNFLQRPQL